MVCAVQAQALSAKEIYSKCKGAIVKIETNRGTGTGFFYLEDNLVATCFHVVADASNIEVKGTDGHSWRVEAVYFDKKSDAALLRVKGDPVSPLPTADPASVSVGDDLTVIGNPLGVLEQTLTTGILSARRETSSVTLFQTSAAISPGSSGSPLITNSGAVLGFISFTFTEGQSLNMAVGASALIQLLKKDAIPLSLFTGERPKGSYEDDDSRPRRPIRVTEDPTEAYVLAVNRIESAFQNWTILWLRISMDLLHSGPHFRNLRSAAKEVTDALNGPEFEQMDSLFQSKKAWKDEAQRLGFMKLLANIGEQTSELYDAESSFQLSVGESSLGDIRRQKSIFIDKDSRLRNSFAVLLAWGTDQDWFSAQTFSKTLNAAATLSGFDFEPSTFIIPDPLFPFRTQIGFTSA